MRRGAALSERYSDSAEGSTSASVLQVMQENVKRSELRAEDLAQKVENERRLREASESHVLSLRTSKQPGRGSEYAYSKGVALRLQPTVAGVCDNFEVWLKYARTARSSFELPPRGMGDNLAAAVTILMLFDAR